MAFAFCVLCLALLQVASLRSQAPCFIRLVCGALFSLRLVLSFLVFGTLLLDV